MLGIGAKVRVNPGKSWRTDVENCGELQCVGRSHLELGTPYVMIVRALA